MLPLINELQCIALSYVPLEGDIKTLTPGPDYGNFRRFMSREAVESSALERLKETNVYDYAAYKEKYPDMDACQYLRQRFSIIYTDTEFSKKNTAISAEDYLLQHKFTAFDIYSNYKKDHPSIRAEQYLIEYDFEQRMAECTQEEKSAILQLAQENASLNFQKIAIMISYVIEDIFRTLLPFCMGLIGGAIIILPVICCLGGICVAALNIEKSDTFKNMRLIFDKNIELVITAIGSRLVENFNYKYMLEVATLCYLFFQAAFIALQIKLEMATGRHRPANHEEINETLNVFRIGMYVSALLTQKPILIVPLSTDVYFSILNPPNWMKNLGEMFNNAVNFNENARLFCRYLMKSEERITEKIIDLRSQWRHELAKDLWVQRVLETH